MTSARRVLSGFAEGAVVGPMFEAEHGFLTPIA
jgi:hypothetical protein